MTDLCNGIIYLQGDQRADTPQCMAQGFFISFFQSALILWMATIAWTLYRISGSAVAVTKFDEPRLLLYHIFVWGGSLALAIMPVIAGEVRGGAPVMSPTGGGGCWIGQDFAVWRTV